MIFSSNTFIRGTSPLLLLVCLLTSLPAISLGLSNGAGLVPPLGWSTWCSGGHCGHDYCDEEMVLGGASALISTGMAALGYNLVLLDDCFVKERDEHGMLVVDEKRFPRGMQAVIEDVHKMNLTIGLYTSVGNLTCNAHGEPSPTPGSEGHYQQDVDLYARWGADYIKADACGDVKKHPLLGPAAYTRMSHAVTHSTPSRPIFLECVGGYAFLLTEVGKYCNSWRTASDHHDSFPSTASTIEMQGYLGLTGKPGAWSFLDILTTGGEGCSDGPPLAHCPRQTDEEYRTELTMWAIVQSPLLVATDIRNMTDIMKELLLNREVVTMHQDTRTPPGKRLAHWMECDEIGKCEVWGREMSDGSHFVALYNAGTKEHTIRVEFHLLGWREGDDLHSSGKQQKANVYDVWKKTQVEAEGSYEAKVAPHNVVFVKITKV